MIRATASEPPVELKDRLDVEAAWAGHRCGDGQGEERPIIQADLRSGSEDELIGYEDRSSVAAVVEGCRQMGFQRRIDGGDRVVRGSVVDQVSDGEVVEENRD